MAISKPALGESDIWARSADPSDKTKPTQGEIDAGFAYGQKPTHQSHNWLFGTMMQFVSHLNSYGIPTWDGTTVYEVAAVTIENGTVWRAVQQNSGSKPSEDDGSNWVAWDPATHSHAWADITGKPSTFPPSAHNHPWADITSKPSEFPPEAHTHPWGDITGKPAEFPPATHTHDDRYLQLSGGTVTGALTIAGQLNLTNQYMNIDRAPDGATYWRWRDSDTLTTRARIAWNVDRDLSFDIYDDAGAQRASIRLDQADGNVKINGAVAAVLGNTFVDSAWADRTNSREPGVDYTNNRDKPIMVSIFASVPAGTHINSWAAISVKVGGVTVGRERIDELDSGGNYVGAAGTISVIVPPGATYSMTIDVGNENDRDDITYGWAELV